MQRSTNQVLAGVVAGLGEELDLDSTVARLLYVVLTLITGFVPGLLIYLVLYLVMDPPDAPRA